ncbi:MAG: hypothetical protein IKF83_02180 [Clostridia bacterium]|nr:hypothetical protein [Clostridia bacterium]
MNNAVIDVFFMIFTLALLCKVIAYGLYEIKSENNFFGGVCTIVFSIVSVVFSNVMVWIN